MKEEDGEHSAADEKIYIQSLHNRGERQTKAGEKDVSRVAKIDMSEHRRRNFSSLSLRA